MANNPVNPTGTERAESALAQAQTGQAERADQPETERPTSGASTPAAAKFPTTGARRSADRGLGRRRFQRAIGGNNSLTYLLVFRRFTFVFFKCFCF